MMNNLSPRPPVRVSRLATGAGILAAALAAVVLSAAPVQQPPAAPPRQLPAPSQQPSEIASVITGDPGTPPRYAVPDFIALSPAAAGTGAQRKIDEAAAAETAKTIGQVLWDDLDFEQEFYMIPRDTYASIPAAKALDTLPFDAWRELGADAVVFGTVQQTAGKITVQVRLVNVRSRRTVFAKEYFNASNARSYAHTIADDLHQQQRQLRGVARTKLAFVSDRNQERLGGTVENREVKEIYTSDYDGANQRRITVSRQLNLNPAWSSDARILAYNSFRPNPDIFLSYIYQGLMQNPTKGVGTNYLPVFSPDGARIAFMSARDGNSEIYVINVDGSNLRRLTNHPASDTTPTWSPGGDRIAFTSDRTGSPQIYVMGADGSNVERITFDEKYADRPTWSRAPYNEIAYSGRTGAGFDIKVYDVATRKTRQVTFGEGSNESPAYSPSGRHLAFTSTRYGSTQVFTIGRNGRGLRQITRVGNNQTPAWSN